MGLQFFAAIFGFLLGIWGAVALSRVHDLEQDDTLVWSLGLVAVLFSFLTPIVFIIVLVRCALKAKQNKELEEGWLISFLRCTWIPIKKRTCCCVMFPLVSMTVFVTTLALETYDTKIDVRNFETFVIGR